ncbi:MAG: WecB/TagA/CpsF family glycosyltransferase, partial [Microbacteriaceae bacterium]|nr:WecB/TagA/CpsF family glycosyltransferase [Microbacteriaceae bacterium]
RAPLFIRSIGFEWFWRLLQEPWRWKRQIALIRFIWLVCEARIVAVVSTRRK